MRRRDSEHDDAGHYPPLIPASRADQSISNTAAGWIGGIYYVGLLPAVALSTALTGRTNA